MLELIGFFSPLHTAACSDVGLQGEVPGSNPAGADGGMGCVVYVRIVYELSQKTKKQMYNSITVPTSGILPVDGVDDGTCHNLFN
jgi:hypothetical protein